jgi:hypothetical protein
MFRSLFLFSAMFLDSQIQAQTFEQPKEQRLILWAGISVGHSFRSFNL